MYNWLMLQSVYLPLHRCTFTSCLCIMYLSLSPSNRSALLSLFALFPPYHPPLPLSSSMLLTFTCKQRGPHSTLKVYHIRLYVWQKGKRNSTDSLLSFPNGWLLFPLLCIPVQTRRLLGNEWVGGVIVKKEQHVDKTTASRRLIKHQSSSAKHTPTCISQDICCLSADNTSNTDSGTFTLFEKTVNICVWIKMLETIADSF